MNKFMFLSLSFSLLLMACNTPSTVENIDQHQKTDSLTKKR
jgi:hypothetical protein